MLMDRVAMNPDLVLQFLFLFSSFLELFHSLYSTYRKRLDKTWELHL